MKPISEAMNLDALIYQYEAAGSPTADLLRELKERREAMNRPTPVDVRRLVSGQQWNAAGTDWEPIYSTYVLESDYRAVEQQRDAALSYARHINDCSDGVGVYCASLVNTGAECSCGLDALLAEIGTKGE
jgi:hypothetical protein